MRKQIQTDRYPTGTRLLLLNLERKFSVQYFATSYIFTKINMGLIYALYFAEVHQLLKQIVDINKKKK